MPIFNFKECFEDLPDNLKTSAGTGVKIAIIDTGSNLISPGMSHLDITGKKYNVTLPGFDPQTAVGDDLVPDDKGHGTRLLSILAGKALSEDKGVVGMAPDAEIFIIKIDDSNGKIISQSLLDALKLCLFLDVDIVTNSSFPDIKDFGNVAEIETELNKFEAKNIIFVSALKNRNIPRLLNKLDHLPINYDYTTRVGVARDKMVAAMTSTFNFVPKINFLIPEVEARFYTENDNTTGEAKGKVTSSHSSAILTGLFALILSVKRKDEPDFGRFSKTEIISEVNKLCTKISKAELENKQFKFYHNA